MEPPASGNWSILLPDVEESDSSTLTSLNSQAVHAVIADCSMISTALALSPADAYLRLVCTGPAFSLTQSAGTAGHGDTMSTPNFRDALNNDDDLNKFDTAAGGDDLGAFDRATGELHVPAGWYLVSVIRGELLTTKNGKRAYRLTLDVADGPRRGFRLWRYYTFDSDYAANRARAALVPLGLTSSADLRKLFPGPGRTVTLRALVGVQTRPDGTLSNDIERFEVVSDTTAPINPNAVNLEGLACSEGGAT